MLEEKTEEKSRQFRIDFAQNQMKKDHQPTQQMIQGSPIVPAAPQVQQVQLDSTPKQGDE